MIGAAMPTPRETALARRSTQASFNPLADVWTFMMLLL
jgi:hypothetical protein